MVSFFLRSLCVEELLVVLLLLLLRNLKLICASLCFEFLNLAQPALFCCFEIWKRLSLIGRTGGTGRACRCSAVNDILGSVARRRCTLNNAVNVRRTRMIHQNVTGPRWPEEARARCRVLYISERCCAAEWGQ